MSMCPCPLLCPCLTLTLTLTLIHLVTTKSTYLYSGRQMVVPRFPVCLAVISNCNDVLTKAPVVLGQMSEEAFGMLDKVRQMLPRWQPPQDARLGLRDAWWVEEIPDYPEVRPGSTQISIVAVEAQEFFGSLTPPWMSSTTSGYTRQKKNCWPSWSKHSESFGRPIDQ
ncbi:hypothetical protein OG21DRAFT_1525783 [Imleria badia]|nr:hypothetical protein OG21DRAFT_1525783 [Imleria badia]